MIKYKYYFVDCNLVDNLQITHLENELSLVDKKCKIEIADKDYTLVKMNSEMLVHLFLNYFYNYVIIKL